MRDFAPCIWVSHALDLKQSDLVVLSACQTQLGDLSAGDEVVGLTRALIFAGDPTVVATLWNVDDAATGRLMERFYTHLNNGLGKAEALRLAQLELIEAGSYAEPYFWSAFVMSGDGGQVSEAMLTGAGEQGSEDVASAILWGWLIGVGGLLLVVVAAGVLWRQRTKQT